jgi:Na+/H+ antiporter NhaD/arsenite permease-like protein
MSLGTKVVTKKEQLAQHKEKQQIQRFNLLLLFLFFLFSLFSLLFLQGPKPSFFMMTTQTIRLLLTSPLKSDLTNLVNIEGPEISTMIAERSE